MVSTRTMLCQVPKAGCPSVTGTVIDGATVASPGGHGMMWGPAVARVAADLALEGRSDVIDVTDLGMDRFDEHGRSPFYDPIALPFPPSAGEADDAN